MFREIYNYRELLKSNVKKEIRGKYKGSFLGVLWSFVNPLLMTLVYAIVFPFILKNSQEHYVTFLITGIIPWTFFTTCVCQGTNTVLINGGIIKKVYFPREILPISVVTSALVNFLISCLIIFIFLIISGIGFSFYVLLLPFIIAIHYILQLGIVLITSAIDVYIRDAEYIINFFVQMLFYATPVLYSSSLFPQKVRWLLNLNPMTQIIDGYRDILFFQQMPNLKWLGFMFIVSLIILCLGIVIFKKLEKGFAEEV